MSSYSSRVLSKPRRRSTLAAVAMMLVASFPVLVAGNAQAEDLPILVVTPNNAVITYGGATPPLSSTVGPFQGEDDETSTGYIEPTCTTSYTMGDSAGDYDITCSGASATGYTIDEGAVGTLTVNKAVLTVIPDPETVTYGGPVPEYTFDLDGFITGDSASSLTGYTAPTCGSPYAPGDAVGTALTITCSGGVSDNYSFNVSATDAVTITKATLTVTPEDQTVIYGDAFSDYTFQLSGFKVEDDATSLTAAPTCTSDYAVGDAVGTTATISCSGGSSDNYDFDFTAEATLTVAAATLTVTPEDQTVTYGNAASEYLFDVDGFVDEEDEFLADGYVPPTCSAEYAVGDPAGSYDITCAGGAADDYEFDYNTATLTVEPLQLLDDAVWYTGQTRAYTASSSDTVAQVTLSASVSVDFDGIEGANSCESGQSVSDGTVTFIDQISGRIVAKNVPIAEVAGNCEEGIATTFATLNSGQYGTEAYVISVVTGGSFAGSNTTQIASDSSSATVMVSQPAPLGGVQGMGSLVVIDGTTSTELGTEGSLTGTMEGSAATTTFRFVPGTRKFAPKGQAVIVIPAENDSYYYIKTNSITSMTAGSTSTVVLTKASISTVGGSCETTCASEGNVSVRLEVMPDGMVGFTVQSSKTSALYYSNDWYKSGRAWKTRPHALI